MKRGINDTIIGNSRRTQKSDAHASYWALFRGKPFYCPDYVSKYKEITEEEAKRFRRSECCFTHIIGLPRKAGRLHLLYDYVGWLIEDEKRHRHRYILKATGLGVTELKLRRYAWKSVSTRRFAGGHGCIVTGPRIDLAIDIIDRIKALFAVPFQTRNTIVNLNGVKIEAFPSHHLDAMRGLNPIFVYMTRRISFLQRSRKTQGRSRSATSQSQIPR